MHSGGRINEKDQHGMTYKCLKDSGGKRGSTGGKTQGIHFGRILTAEAKRRGFKEAKN